MSDTPAALHAEALQAAASAARCATAYHRASEHMRPELADTARIELELAQVTALVAISATLQELVVRGTDNRRPEEHS